MKIRNGFVSNSSSSSFICEISGRVESGMDMGIEDAGMYECVNGHTFDEDYVLDYDYKEMIINKLEGDVKRHGNKYGDEDHLLKIKELDRDDIDDYIDNNDIEIDDKYSLPEIACPICQMKNTTNGDLISYLLKELNKKREEVEEDIRVKYSDFDAFKKDLNK